MIVRKLRLDRGWSQDQLAQFSGLNIRTIQRIESGHKAGLESLKALAAVFEIDINQLQPEPSMENIQVNSVPEPTTSTPHWRTYRNRFVLKAIRTLLLIGMLFLINWLTGPRYLWAWWPTLGLGLSLAYTGINMLFAHYIGDTEYVETMSRKERRHHD